MKRSRTQIVLRMVRIAVAVVVSVAIVIAVAHVLAQLREHPLSLSETKWWRLPLAGIFYLGALSTGGVFWHYILGAMGHPVPLFDSYRTFLTSQLGKYVPGKAMVIVIRTAEIRRFGVPVSIGATTVFIETLTWISVGAVMGAALVGWLFQDRWQVGLLAAAAAVLACLPTIPAVMRRLLAVLRIQADATRRWRARDVLFGWLIFSIGWLLNGCGLWLVLSALPGANITLADYPLCLASISLATVIGFVSLLPVGIGVRELVMAPLLGNRFGLVVAMLAVILLRLVTISSELIAVAIMYLSKRRRQDSSSVDLELSQQEDSQSRQVA